MGLGGQRNREWRKLLLIKFYSSDKIERNEMDKAYNKRVNGPQCSIKWWEFLN
jgi:hypothetical protein